MNDILLINISRELETMTDDNLLAEEQETLVTKTKTKSFKRFFLEKLLKEAPDRYTGTWADMPLEDWAYNKTEASNYVEGGRGKLVDTFEHNGKVRIYRADEKPPKTFPTYPASEYALIPENMVCIMGYVRIVIIDKHVTTNGIWNHSIGGKGLIYNFFIKWLLPHYKLVISDDSTTPKGEMFWKKIIQYGLSNNKECGVYILAEPNLNRPEQFTKMNTLEEFESAWSERGFTKRIYIKE